MAVLIDTSAILALLDAQDPNHAQSAATFRRLGVDRETIVAHNYVVIESIALLQRRFGVDAVRRLVSMIAPVLSVVWIDTELHDRGLTALLASGRRAVSLVDHLSFVVMHERGIRQAFAFDDDFAAQGFELVTA